MSVHNFFPYNGKQDISYDMIIKPQNHDNNRDGYIYSPQEIYDIITKDIYNKYIPPIYYDYQIGFKGCKVAKDIYNNTHDFYEAFNQFSGYTQICADKIYESYPDIYGVRFLYLFPNTIPDIYTRDKNILDKIISIIYKTCKNFYMAYLITPTDYNRNRYCIHIIFCNASYNHYKGNKYLSKNINSRIYDINYNINEYITELSKTI